MQRRQFLAGLGIAGLSASSTAAPALTRADVPGWDQTAEVVVVGAGAAGVCAALAARAAGGSVLLLEALSQVGGTSAISDGVLFAGGGTFVQGALGVQDSPSAMYDVLVDVAGPNPPLARIKTYCQGSADHLDWLRAQGVTIAGHLLPESPSTAPSDIPQISRKHVVEAPPGLAGQQLMQGLVERARAEGVQISTGESAQRLIMEADGRVLGIATQQGSRTRYLRARKGVVLTAGGFIRQREMVMQYAPHLYDCATPWGGAGDLGQGIRLGISAGAAALRMESGFCGIDLKRLSPAPSGLLVNASGQRFIAEDTAPGAIGHAVMFEQKGAAWLIVDAASAPPPDQQDYPVLHQATSIGELAERLMLPRGALQQSVAYYNRYAARGEDPQFGKSRAYLRPFQGPPYRALAVSGPRAFLPAYTLGGLATDLNGAVLDSFGAPIAGLFAAGRTTASLPVAPAVLEGLALGDATFFGRSAGRGAMETA